jgi:hypothetical protein
LPSAQAPGLEPNRNAPVARKSTSLTLVTFHSPVVFAGSLRTPRTPAGKYHPGSDASKTKRRACQKNQPEFHALNRAVAIHVAIHGDSAIGRSLTARRAGLSWKLDQGAVIAEYHPRT